MKRSLSNEALSYPMIENWFLQLNLLGQQKPDQLPRVLESFWPSQLSSKLWLIQELSKLEGIGPLHTINVYGGWYGILAGLIGERFPKARVVSSDIDMSVIPIGKQLNPNVVFAIHDMNDGLLESSTPYVVDINTSSEHISQDVYDRWVWNKIQHTTVERRTFVVQGNDFFEHHEHVRCFGSLVDFVEASRLNTIDYAGTLDCGTFRRFMVIGSL